MRTFKTGDLVALRPMSELEALEDSEKVPHTQLEAFRTWGYRNSLFKITDALTAHLHGEDHYQQIILETPGKVRLITLGCHLFTADYFQLAQMRYPSNHRSRIYAH